MISVEVNDKIHQFLEGQITLHELDDWIVPYLPCLAVDPHSADMEIVSVIELGIAEIDDGISSEEILRNQLLNLIKNINLMYEGDPCNESLMSSSSNETIVPSQTFWIAEDNPIVIDCHIF